MTRTEMIAAARAGKLYRTDLNEADLKLMYALLRARILEDKSATGKLTLTERGEIESIGVEHESE